MHDSDMLPPPRNNHRRRPEIAALSTRGHASAGLQGGLRFQNGGNDLVDGVGERQQVVEFFLLGELEEKGIDGLALVLYGTGGG